MRRYTVSSVKCQVVTTYDNLRPGRVPVQQAPELGGDLEQQGPHLLPLALLLFYPLVPILLTLGYLVNR